MKQWPREIRRSACQAKRLAADWFSGRGRMVASSGDKGGGSFPVQLSLEQRVLPTEFVGAKIHNIGLGIERMQNLRVPPLGIFSFWRAVGRPAHLRGFLPGRSLLGGKLVPDYGGGLCQLSGIIYHLSLLAGLKIIERHPHSRDIYDDDNRYTPLGADAAVAYGFKDLRVGNNLPVPVCFRATINSEKLTAMLCSPEKIATQTLEFAIIKEANETRLVETRQRHPNEKRFQSLNISTYRRL
jgi:vancomycin resistance protein VanW